MNPVIVFYVSKESGNFFKYQIIYKPIEEVESIVKNINEKEGNTYVIFVQKNQHVIDAILQKESSDTVKAYCNDISSELNSARSLISSARDFMDSLDEHIKRNFNPKCDCHEPSEYHFCEKCYEAERRGA